MEYKIKNTIWNVNSNNKKFVKIIFVSMKQTTIMKARFLYHYCPITTVKSVTNNENTSENLIIKPTHGVLYG